MPINNQKNTLQRHKKLPQNKKINSDKKPSRPLAALIVF